jgi:hypothetical protein
MFRYHRGRVDKHLSDINVLRYHLAVNISQFSIITVIDCYYWKLTYLSDMLPNKNGLKQDVLSSLLFNLTLEYAIRRVQVK